MLTFKLDGDILEVTETRMSFTDTKISYWYYDIKKWQTSSHGKKNDKLDRACTRSDIDWCKKYYLPRVGINVDMTGNQYNEMPND